MSEDPSLGKISSSQMREGCVIVMIFFTLLAGCVSSGVSLDPFPLVIAFGLSALAIAILHLTRVLQDQEK